MGLRTADDGELRFAGYVEGLVSVIGHADRAGPLRDYCTGLIMPCERKSVEPMAAITAPERTAAQHQSLLHFVGQGGWSDAAVLGQGREVGVPEEITFKTKPEIALEQIRWACEADLPGGMVLLDAGYGHDSKLRRGITELGKRYVAGIQPQTLVWAPRTRPGRAPKKGRRDAANAISVKEVALRLRAKAWHPIRWREGTNEWLSSRFARVRVSVASSHERAEKPAKEWL